MHKPLPDTLNIHLISFQQGEEKGFAWFFRLYYPTICFFANRLINDRLEAEDITDEAFIKLWERRGNFETAESIKNFLYLTVRNACFDLLRHQKVINVHREVIGRLNPTEDNFVLQEMIRSEVLGELYQAIEKLPAQCRKVFRLLYLEGKNYHEIASELQLSVNTIRNQKAIGIQLIKKKLPALFGMFIFIFSRLCDLTPIHF